MIDCAFDFTARQAALQGARIAFEDLETGETVSYRGLEDRAARAAGLLVAMGIGEGDRVAVLSRNRVGFFELLFACGKIGAVLVPLNWRMPPAELAPLIDRATPKLLCAGAEDRATATESLTRASHAAPFLDLDSADPKGYAARRDATDPLVTDRAWPGDRLWYLLFTSGTTGAPKAVMQTVRMAVVNAVNIGNGTDLRASDTTINFLPLFHTAGINLHTLPTLLRGGRVLLLPGFDADPVMAALKAGRISVFFAVPAVYQALSLHPEFAGFDPSPVRNWGCGGAPLPDALAATYLARGIRIMGGMGMTETGPTVFFGDAHGAEHKVGSVGRPQLLADVAIVDGDGRPVPAGESGELLIRGPGVTPGYWHDPEATRAAFTPDGWLKTGDIAMQDADGYYYIVGRKKDMFISGGENVFPAEVENVLTRHEAVLEAAVIGIDDDKWGEVGAAFLLPCPGHTLPDSAELSQFCRARLAPFKVPKRFVCVDDFPRTAAGKIQKHLIDRSLLDR
ncbi:class I adenylate-forming enzyme family protein [Yunchengibacter salinarum]|uniref:class I adenylate-forming enzyme family protein n=1 Tax=Yunchengibacter salinarum TaxID=3133399 RepID=UPI0035B5BAA8